MVNFYTYIEIYLDDLNKSVSLSEFEKYFNKSHQIIKLHLKELVERNILIEDKRARFLFYKLNKKNPLLFEYISICEKERLFMFLNRNELFNRLYELVHDDIKESKILIFGSCVKSDKFNDIDILLIPKNDLIILKLKDFMKTYDVKLHIINTLDKNLTVSFINEIRINHIMFNEHDYFLRILYKNEL